MPHLNNARKAALRANIFLAENPGDLNFLLTLVILRSFKEYPRYERIHVLRRDFVTDPKNNKALNQLRNDFAHIFKVSDIYTAAALAFEEFYRLVGSKYEDLKIKENGMVEEYQEVLDLIEGKGPSVLADQEEVKA